MNKEKNSTQDAYAHTNFQGKKKERGERERKKKYKRRISKEVQ